MLFIEKDLALNAFDLLNEITYLSQEESCCHVKSISLKENLATDSFLVDFKDLETLCETYGINYSNGINLLAETNDIYPELIACNIPEELIIESPELERLIPQVVVSPLSSQDPISLLAETIISDCIEQEDENLLESFCNYLIQEGKVGKVGKYMTYAGLGYLLVVLVSK